MTASERLQAAHSTLAGPVRSVIDATPVATFVIDAEHKVTHWNNACEQALGIPAAAMLGTDHHWQAFYTARRPLLADLLLEGARLDDIARHYQGGCRPSPYVAGALEAEGFFPHLGPQGRWLHFTAALLRDETGLVVGAIETLEDITDRRLAESQARKAHEDLEILVARRTAELSAANEQLAADIRRQQLADAELRRRNIELTEVNEKLSTAQSQLMQSEKLASIGQLAAGVAHEINNPIGYIFSNFATLRTYLDSVFAMLAAYEQSAALLPADQAARLAALRRELDIDFLLDDVPSLMAESHEGIQRVRGIVQDLKDFSRSDQGLDWQWSDLHRGIDSTLNIVNNEVKYVADVVRRFGSVPDIECIPSQINQVVLNLVVNAAHACNGGQRGTITIRTGTAHEGGKDLAWFEVSDTGCGIPRDALSRIFDPFYTTKPVGKGTGLGLALSYRIVEKHGGRIEVDSTPGAGSTFRVTLPVRQSEPSATQGASP